MLQKSHLKYKTRIKIYGGGRQRSTSRYYRVNMNDILFIYSL
jgi:hypothetical protein